MDIADVKQWRCLEESGKLLENVDQTNRALASGMLVLKMVKLLKTVSAKMAPKMKPIVVLFLWVSCFASANLDNNEAARAALEDSRRVFQEPALDQADMESRSAEIC